MKLIKTTIYKMLIQNSMPVIVLAFIFCLIAVIKGLPSNKFLSQDLRVLMFLVSSFLIFSVVLGIILNKICKDYQQTYLWHTNKNYKNTIQITAALILLVMNVILMCFFYWHGQFKFLVFVLAIVLTLNGFYFNKYSDLILLAIPFVILFGKSYDLSLSLTLTILIIYYVFLLVQNYLFADKHPILTKKRTVKGSYYSDNKLSKWITFSNANIDWAIARPSIIYALPSLFFSTVICFYLWFMNTILEDSLDMRVILFVMLGLNLSNIFIMYFSVRQTQTFAHVFVGASHKGIKDRIIKSFDKLIIVQNLVFILVIMSFVAIFEIKFDRQSLLANLLFVLIVIYVSYPLIFRFKTGWSFLVYIVSIILAVLFFNNQSQVNPNDLLSLKYLFVGVVVSVIVRRIGHLLFLKIPYEKLVKIIR